jgi:putative MATE family efflux protein
METEEGPQKHQAQYSANMPVESDIPIDAEAGGLSVDRTKLSLMHFAWPILIENVIRVGITSADVFMLSAYAEEAVAATGLINQLVFFINVLYLMVASGASILISQNLGARNTAVAGRVAQGSVVLSAAFSALLSAALCVCASPIVAFYKLDPQVHEFAVQYMVIYSAGSVSVAVCMILSTIIRSYGHSRGPMLINGAAMAVSIAGNYVLIFGNFGAPELGVRGAALSTIASQIFACGMLYVMLRRRRDIVLERGGIFRVPSSVYRQILAVGVPTAGENLSYNIGQIIIMRFIASLGTEAMAAFVYAVTVLRFVFITSISIGTAAQIKVGYFVGAGMANIAQRKVYRYFALGVAISACLAVTVKIFQSPILHVFTQNAGIHAMAFGILTIALIHEPGRNFNVIIIPALKGAGDVRFPVYVGMLFMWGVGVTLAYVFGITLGWGLIGICVAMAIDEWTRGIVMFFRWRGGRWKTKALVRNDAAAGA